jgi:hypothetical protein
MSAKNSCKHTAEKAASMEPVGESIGNDGAVNRVASLVTEPFNVMNPELFRLDQSELDQPVVKTVLTAIPIRKPEPLEFVRVHADPNYRMGPVPLISLKKSREFYLVVPTLRRELKPREYWIGEIFLATNRLDKPFFWITTIQSPTGRVSDWYNSGIECAERAMHEWVQIVADQDAGVYTVALAEDKLEEPQWPEQTFAELFQLAFKRRTVDNLSHPVFKQLRGKN